MAKQQDTEKSASAGDSKQVVRPATGASQTAGKQLTFGNRWAYAEAPEARDHVQIRERYDLFIDGRWQAPKSKDCFATQNPDSVHYHKWTLSRFAEAWQSGHTGRIRFYRISRIRNFRRILQFHPRRFDAATRWPLSQRPGDRRRRYGHHDHTFVVYPNIEG